MPEEYWTVECDCRAAEPPPFVARIWRWDGERPSPRPRPQADEIAAELRRRPGPGAPRSSARSAAARPQPPFITSKLQQEAASKLRFSAKKTMALAQRLYEGIELGEEGPVGLITYMRTDSTRLSDDALTEVARATSPNRYGADYLPDEPVVYKTTKSAQDAHEAIRPTTMDLPPERVAKLSRSPRAGRSVKLYTLIWNRFVACQMTPAVYDQTTVDIARGQAVVRATGQVMKFAGYTAVYMEQESDDEAAEKAADCGQAPAAADRGRRGRPWSRSAPSSTSPSRRRASPRRRWSRSWRRRASAGRRPTPPSSRPSWTAATSSRRERPLLAHRAGHAGQRAAGRVVPRHPRRPPSPRRWSRTSTRSRRASADWRDLLGQFYRPFKDDLEQARETDARRQARGDPHRVHLREVRHAHGDQVGPQRLVPGLPGLPRVPQHQGDQPQPRRHHRDRAGRDHRRGVRELRRAHGGQAGPLRLVPGLLALPRLQDHQADLAGGQLPQGQLRRLPDREAVAPRQGVLRLLQLRQERLRLRHLGPAHPRGVPRVRRGVHGQEGEPQRHHGAVPDLHLQEVGLRAGGEMHGAARARGRRRGPAA